jgi:hypothetical protein
MAQDVVKRQWKLLGGGARRPGRTAWNLRALHLTPHHQVATEKRLRIPLNSPLAIAPNETRSPD